MWRILVAGKLMLWLAGQDRMLVWGGVTTGGVVTDTGARLNFPCQ